jgi:feruloyl esterase
MPLLRALERWVEEGRAPESIVATLSEGSAAPGATRPLCEYPEFPRYTGKGDPREARSFTCATE